MLGPDASLAADTRSHELAAVRSRPRNAVGANTPTKVGGQSGAECGAVGADKSQEWGEPGRKCEK